MLNWTQTPTKYVPFSSHDLLTDLIDQTTEAGNKQNKTEIAKAKIPNEAPAGAGLSDFIA